MRRSHSIINQTVAHTLIATTCLAYLLQFDQRSCVNHTTVETYPLFDYAAQNWIHHAKSDADDGSSDTLHKLVLALLQPSSAPYTNWLCLHSPDIWGSSEKCSPLYYTSLTGLERASRSLLSSGSDVNAKGGMYGNPLQAASAHGHTRIVRLLLESGADVTTQGGWYGNALRAASAEGHDEIVQLLLEQGAEDVTPQEGWGWYSSALEAASSGGHDKVVRLLEKKGADKHSG